MDIRPDPDLKAQALDALRSQYGMDETRPGIHQSQVTYCLTRSYWDLTDPEPVSDKEALLFGIGFGMERVLLRPFEAQPEPLELDGIVVSLDSVHQFGGPIDIKTTRMAPAGRKGEDGFLWPDSWKRAFMAYRHVLNVLTCDCGHLKHQHYAGPHEHSPAEVLCPCQRFQPMQPQYDFGCCVIHLIQPEMTAWRITYEPWELTENWRVLCERKAQLEMMLATSDPQPFKWQEDWECPRCTYQLRCALQKSIEELSNV